MRKNIDPEKRREWLKMFQELRNEGLSKMRHRHTGFMEIVKEYTSFDDFLRDWEYLMTLFGTEVYEGSDCISLRIQIDDTDYEEYHVIMGRSGHLTMSAAAWWQNDCCANELTNIFTGKAVEIDDIANCFPPVSDSDDLERHGQC